MLLNAIAAGLRAIGSRPGLAALLFLLNLALALVLAVPVGTALDLAVSGTGFDADLAGGLDIVLLTDILGDNPDFFAVLLRQLIWLLPLLLVWNAAQGAGLVHALRGDATGSFWTGVGRHFGRVLGLTALYAVMAVIVIGLSVIVASVIQAVSGEKWTVLGWTVIFPIMLMVGLAKLDMMQDYGRIAIVHGGAGVFQALFSGIAFPLRHAWAFLLYGAWAAAALLFWIAPTLVEAAVGASFAIFLLQQVLLLGRSALTVGWIASEVTYAEAFPAPAPEVIEQTGEWAAEPA